MCDVFRAINIASRKKQALCCASLWLIINNHCVPCYLNVIMSRDKEVSAAARSLIGLFRELAPSMLVRKDRGRGADLAAAPSAYGAVQVCASSKRRKKKDR